MCVSMISLLVSDVGDKLGLVRKKESNDNEKDGIDSNELKLEEWEEKNDVDFEKDLVFMI